MARQNLEHSMQAFVRPEGEAERANSIYDLPSIKQAIHWMHAVLGYPAASTWLKACRAGNFRGFPFDDVKYIRKYYPETDETPAGHLSRQRQNLRSTKPKPVPFQEIDVSELQGKKERDVYIKIVETKGTIYSDQTGRFPVQSQSKNKYIMLMVEIDSNAVLVEPMTSRKNGEMQRAYLKLLKRLQRAGVVPRKHVLDNEVSKAMKDLIRETCKLELVPPYCHRWNVAEVQIKNFKAHIISILAGSEPDFPINLWDKLLPQTKLTFNLLRQSNTAPKVSAHAHLFGPFDYNRAPLAPLGCAVNVHVPPEIRTSWGIKIRPGWHFGFAPDHYRAYINIDQVTKRESVSQTVAMKHKRIMNPTVSDSDKVVRAVRDLQSVARGRANERGDKAIRELQRLADAVATIVERHAGHRKDTGPCNSKNEAILTEQQYYNYFCNKRHSHIVKKKNNKDAHPSNLSAFTHHPIHATISHFIFSIFSFRPLLLLNFSLLDHSAKQCCAGSTGCCSTQYKESFGRCR